MLTRLITSIADEDLSIVVVDNSTNALVGVILGKDLATPDVDNSDLVAQWPEFQAYRECIFTFNVRHPELFTTTGLGQKAKLFYMTVKVESQGHGLATMLVGAGLEHSKLNKFPVVVGQAVSKFTVKIVQKMESMGIKVIDSEEYEKFKTEKGEYPFGKIKEELAKKRLSEEHLYLTLIVMDKNQAKAGESC